MEDQPSKENDEEMVGVPEDLKVATPNDLHGWGDDEDEGQGDDDPREPSDGSKCYVGRCLGHSDNIKVSKQSKFWT